ncbi:hypothetical protein NC653_029891 [Populus alba x Populus x berolinensis]|uniref:Protein kinase domain-containing protein n=1 Tax=Populus alba x Populus x berolinensis TaxID=444605 RepID=A0AAD6Q3Q1_9ROSI|nr:hypothetical protein NC653_029891 [Populus alba x Populus x berolinensis]
MAEQKLTPTVSLSNSTEQGLFSLSVTYKGLFASVEYYQHVGNAAEMNKESTFVRFMNGSLDGHLGVYEWEEFDRFGWNEVADLFKEEIDECSYPTVCGKFGICSKGQKCRCPEPTIQGTTYFKQVIEKQPEIGCLEITPLSCNASQSQIFLEYHSDPAVGDCYLPPDIFSLKDSDNSGYHSVYLKVLGEGGFGKVFEGILLDGTKIAVKQLNGSSQVRKSFLTEVEAIGSIHHVNLARLLGFCSDKFNKLLVYEYMSNGSLDNWIFYKTCEFVLDWHQKKKIILDIARDWPIFMMNVGRR